MRATSSWRSRAVITIATWYDLQTERRRPTGRCGRVSKHASYWGCWDLDSLLGDWPSVLSLGAVKSLRSAYGCCRTEQRAGNRQRCCSKLHVPHKSGAVFIQLGNYEAICGISSSLLPVLKYSREVSRALENVCGKFWLRATVFAIRRPIACPERLSKMP